MIEWHTRPVNEWAQYIHRWAESKGWWDEERNFGEMIALVHSELSEALEEWRSGKDELYYDGDKPEGIDIELVDAVIRLFDMLGSRGVDIELLLHTKMAYNETRSYRHGNKRA